MFLNFVGPLIFFVYFVLVYSVLQKVLKMPSDDLYLYPSVCRKRRLVESYSLGRQIGSGGFGAVLNAVCKTTGKQVGSVICHVTHLTNKL